MRKSKPHKHGRFSVSCTGTGLCQALCSVHRQLQNFCDKDITNSNIDTSYTGRPIQNRTQPHGKLKDLLHVRVGYGYDLIHLFDVSDTWPTDYEIVFRFLSNNCPYVAYGDLF